MKNLILILLLTCNFCYPFLSTNLSWKAPVANSGALPSSGNVAGDCRAAQNTGVSYCWNGSSWVSGGGGGGGTPGGSDTQLQYNNAGSFGGISGATWNGTRVNIPSIEGVTVVPPATTTFNVLPSMSVILVQSGVLNTAINLPQITSATNGKIINIVNADGSGSTSINTIAFAGDSIQGNFINLDTTPYNGLKLIANLADNSWWPVLASPSDLFIGSPVSPLGNENRVLFIDGSGYLGASSSLVYDGQALSCPPGILANPGVRFSSSSGMMEDSTNTISLVANSLRSAQYTDTYFAMFPDSPYAVGFVPDGSISLGGTAGTAGQVPISAGAGAPVSWGDVTAVKANYLYDTAGTPLLSADGVNRILYASDGTAKVLDWTNAYNASAQLSFDASLAYFTTNVDFGTKDISRVANIRDGSGVAVLDTTGRTLVDPTGTHLLDFSNVETGYPIYFYGSLPYFQSPLNSNAAHNPSADINGRLLIGADGTTAILDWNVAASSSSAYWFDSAHGNKLTGDGSGLTGVIALPSIGNAVTGATINEFLFVDNSGNLAQNAAFSTSTDGTRMLVGGSQDDTTTALQVGSSGMNIEYANASTYNFHISADGSGGLTFASPNSTATYFTVSGIGGINNLFGIYPDGTPFFQYNNGSTVPFLRIMDGGTPGNINTANIYSSATDTIQIDLTNTNLVSVPNSFQTGMIIDNIGPANSISPNSRFLYAGDGTTKVLDWHTDTSNTNSAAYWFDSANSNRLTGDGSGLTGITTPIAIGAAVSSGTAGSVLFVDGSGNLAQDNANFIYDTGTQTLAISNANIPVNFYAGGTISGSEYTLLVDSTGTHFYDGSGTEKANVNISGEISAISLNVATISTPAATDLLIKASTDATTGQNIYITAPDGATTDGFVRIAGGNDAGNGYIQIAGPKLGFFGATPINIVGTGISAAAFVGNTSGTLDDSATYGGYTIGQIVAALQAYGLLQ